MKMNLKLNAYKNSFKALSTHFKREIKKYGPNSQQCKLEEEKKIQDVWKIFYVFGTKISFFTKADLTSLGFVNLLIRLSKMESAWINILMQKYRRHFHVAFHVWAWHDYVIESKLSIWFLAVLDELKERNCIVT